LLFRFSGEFLLRFAERQLPALLFQLPPRFTRSEACGRSPAIVLPPLRASAKIWPLPRV
jgi:hypothetical protein